ncbi:hypothetical protein NUSPORA_02272 [Nucleospora cyclopteri]
MHDNEYVQILGNNSVPPADIREGFLEEESHQLFMVSMDDKTKQLLADKKNCYNISKKKPKKSPWTTEGKQPIANCISPDGTFTAGGPAKPIFYNWIVQGKGEDGKELFQGPLVNKEMKNLLYQNKLAGTKIKRECDNVFVPFEHIYEKYDNFIYVEQSVIDEIFREYEMNLQEPIKEQFYDEVVFLEEKKFSKTAAFLKRHNLEFNKSCLIKMVKAKTKKNAIETLKAHTKMAENNVKVLLDLLLEEAKFQILVDVDKDGFFIQNNNKNKNPQKKYTK